MDCIIKQAPTLPPPGAEYSEVTVKTKMRTEKTSANEVSFVVVCSCFCSHILMS